MRKSFILINKLLLYLNYSFIEIYLTFIRNNLVISYLDYYGVYISIITRSDY